MSSRSLIGKTLAFALVVVLAGLCLVELVHAAMPSEMATDCATRLCNAVTGCEPTVPAVVVHTVTPLATVPVTVIVSAPTAPTPLTVVTEFSPTPKHHVRPSAPRSPPLV